MKRLITILLPALLAASCLHKGAESKYVKFMGCTLVSDGNNNDSSFFKIDYENKSDQPLKDPFVRMVIKDTSDKMFKPILFSASDNLDDIPAHTAFTVSFYSEGFQYSDATGKTKYYLSWTNSNGKRSIRRRVEH